MGDNSSAFDYDHDYDYLIVGSGFGGSVSALRLAEKGYRVGVLYTGRRCGWRRQHRLCQHPVPGEVGLFQQSPVVTVSGYLS